MLLARPSSPPALIPVLVVSLLLSPGAALAQSSELSELIDILRKADEAGDGLDEPIAQLLQEVRRKDRAEKPPLRPLSEVTAQAEAGDVEAQVQLGRRYLNGIEVKVDASQAAHWYRKAAEAGNSEAQYWLADILTYGSAGRRDLQEAAEWFGKAMDSGHPSAPSRLGYFYEHGKVGEPDPAAAARLYEKAALRRHGGAMCLLGLLYAEGKGVDQNPVTGLAWYLVAARIYRPSAYQSDFEAIAETLSEEELNAASAKARELLKRVADSQ